MRVTHGPLQQLTSGHLHHAFTSCAYWRKTWYVAYREAHSHHILPPGGISLRTSTDLSSWAWDMFFELYDTHGDRLGDLRDPRLIPSDEALYCLCAAYLPRLPATTLSRHSSENIIQSYITYTEDGRTWAPLTPIGRPGYWIWSALPLRSTWVAAAYHTGAAGETSSIHLLGGRSLLTLAPDSAIYDGANLDMEDHAYRFAHTTVSEPVLYQPTTDTIACCVRTEGGSETMELGLRRLTDQDWRWWDTKQMIHPSAMIETPHGWLLAGRELVKPPRGAPRPWQVSTSLFHVEAQTVTRVLRLPSALDTGYAGLCQTAQPDTMLLSYYSQHATGARYGTPLPGAHVFVTLVTVAD